MIKVFSLRKSKRWLTLIVLCAVVVFLGYKIGTQKSAQPAMSSSDPLVREIHMVTGEYKSGNIEAYRWDPGTIVVREGEEVVLKIYGVNGERHPFEIRGLDVKGEVVKGKETTVSFKTNKAGVYELVCLAHPDIQHNGPMIGYIVVVDE